MSARVDVKPELLRWAWERSRIEDAVLRDRFPRLEEWTRGEKQPTFRQLEDFARTTHVPLGYLARLLAESADPLPYRAVDDNHSRNGGASQAGRGRAG